MFPSIDGRRSSSGNTPHIVSLLSPSQHTPNDTLSRDVVTHGGHTPVSSPRVANCGSSLTRRASNTMKPTPPSPSASPRHTRPPVAVTPTHNVLTSNSIEQLTQIPREFYVIETNAILPQKQYPAAQYQSTFVPGSSDNPSTWETVVFPALAPQTRQQVIFLAQTLEQMRTNLILSEKQIEETGAPNRSLNQQGEEGSVTSVMSMTLEYTEKEWNLYSTCFHELVRQIAFICKEQSELLQEIRNRYDSGMKTLIAQVRVLRADNAEQKVKLHKAQEEKMILLKDYDKLMEQTVEWERAREEASQESSKGRRNRRQQPKNDDESSDSDGIGRRGRYSRRSGNDGESLSDEEDVETDKDDQSESRSDSDNDEATSRVHQAAALENLAAARVQQAFHKYVLRKEHHSLMQREEAKLAALEIQRSYRGWQDRRRVLHKRAVMQTILRQRKEKAAIELLQANVRTYLLRQRREQAEKLAEEEKERKKQQQFARFEENFARRMKGNKHVEVVNTETATEEPSEPETKTANEKNQIESMVEVSDDPTTIQFAKLLQQVGELSSAFSVLCSSRLPKSANAIASSNLLTRTPPMTTPNQRASSEIGTVVPKDTKSYQLASEESPATVDKAIGDIDTSTTSLLTQTSVKVDDFVRAFRSAIFELQQREDGGCREFNSELTKSTSTSTLTPSDPDTPDASLAAIGSDPTTDVSSLHTHFADGLFENGFVFIEDRDGRKSHWDRDRSSSRFIGTGHMSSTHLTQAPELLEEEGFHNPVQVNDILWETAIYSPQQGLPVHEHDGSKSIACEVHSSNNAVANTLGHELTLSREQKKRHAALKHFIVDIYETVVGRIRELPSTRRAQLIKIHCTLALSHVDWQTFTQRRSPKRLDDASQCSIQTSLFEPVTAFVRINLVELIREHYHCQWGLKSLVDNAMAELEASLTTFKDIDPDVARFNGYLIHERTNEELIFFCVCRYLATGAMVENTTSELKRQPVFQPISLRELIDVNRAVEVARALFDVENEKTMLSQDAFVIELTNEIYKRHLPTSNLQQLEEFVRNIFPSANVTVDKSMNKVSNSSTYTRASNTHHFHAREYSTSASRNAGILQGEGDCKWIYFDEFVDLLRRYQTVMHQFHAFVRWTLDLYDSAVQQQQRRSENPGNESQLLDEIGFIQAVTPYSLLSTEREMRNVFHNALKQRQLQVFMPMRVFVSVVLVLLKNGVFSVSSYDPLKYHQKEVDSTSDQVGLVGSQEREEKQWVHLALQWRGHEHRFEITIETIYSSPSIAPALSAQCQLTISTVTPDAIALCLLEWRNELYELFVHRSGREHLKRARYLLGRLEESMAAVEELSSETSPWIGGGRGTLTNTSSL